MFNYCGFNFVPVKRMELVNKKEILKTFTLQIVKSNAAFRQYLQTKLKQHEIDLTVEMLQVLKQLWCRDGINQQEIADLVVKDKTSVTYLIDNLSRRKLVYRIEDAEDRRNKLVFLTPEGAALRQTIEPWLQELQAEIGRGISAENLQQCLAVLEKVRANLGSLK